MRYLGGKARLARHIVPVMNVPDGAVYIEPFVGGANVMMNMAHVRHRRGSGAATNGLWLSASHQD